MDGVFSMDKYIEPLLAHGTFVMCVFPSKESENAKSVTGDIEFFRDDLNIFSLKITFENSISKNIKMAFCMDGDKNLLSIFYKNTPKEETDTYKPHYGHLLIELPTDGLEYPLKGMYTNHDRDTKGEIHIYKKESDIPKKAIY